MKKLNRRPFEEAQAEIISISVSDIVTASSDFVGDEDILEDDAE